MTENEHQTGTDRIFEAYQKLNLNNIDYIINLQGDEPMIDVEDIKNLNTKAIYNNSEIATLACRIKDKKIFNSNNIVKVTTDKDLSKDNTSKAKSFTRKFIIIDHSNIYHHIGIYIYKVSILEKFINLKRTQNEISQNLEQLRAMDNNIVIDVVLANSSPIGIDTNEDYLELKKIMEYKP